MFIRLSLLRIRHHHHHHQIYFNYHRCLQAPIVAWPEKLLNSNTSASNVMLWHRHRSDIKRNEELLLSSHGGGTIIIPTPLKIKQAIKSGFHDFIDGYTCIQTSCPTCPTSKEASNATGNATATAADPNVADQAQPGDKCLFINKTTGKYRSHHNLNIFKKKSLNFKFTFIAGDVVCSKCQYIFSFSAIEKFFSKTHRSSDELNRARDLFLRSKPKPTIFTGEMIQKSAKPVKDMTADALDKVITSLDIRRIDSNVLQGVQAFCHEKRNTLYFPMLDSQSNIVGYKKLHRPLSESGDLQRMTETTIPEQSSYGAVIFPPIQKRGHRDQRTAIIVLNMLDALALRMEKTNCE